ncbi:hypothetical protein HUJ05_012233 [Dendroctonus ponderosae]|nr:hypothetical protein HUJ05_012233 [Dendroctonus ponderosae]
MFLQVTNYFACAPVPQTGNRSHFAYRHWRVERVVFHALFHGGENYEIVVRNLIKFTFNFTILNDGFQNLTCQRLRKHLVESHSVQITPEHYTFNTDAEFDYWKHTIEDKMKVNYVKDSRCRTLKSGAVRSIYICHRSYAPRDKNNQLKKRFRNLDSNKISKACPSILVVTTTPHKPLVVLYPVHIGHSNELGRLSIPSIDKQQIAGKCFLTGVSVSRILNDIRADISEDGVKRIHLIEKQDIHNIKRYFSIGYVTKRHQNDAVSVKLWVDAMNNMENSPVLFYKEQGLEDAVFDKNDFVLIIMTDFQANCLSKFGSNKICIDGTHGLNAYGCQLYTILVVNDYGSGMTVAFCFSNRQDIAIFKFMFEIIKKSVGVITTEVFMSDDYPAFYLAWESIMGRVDKRLLCTWRVNRN